MARIAFILLCHKDPKGIIAQAQRLTGSGDFVSIHFDARANPADFEIPQGYRQLSPEEVKQQVAQLTGRAPVPAAVLRPVGQ